MIRAVGQVSPWGTNVPFNFVPRNSPEHWDPSSDATRVQLNCPQDAGTSSAALLRPSGALLGRGFSPTIPLSHCRHTQLVCPGVRMSCVQPQFRICCSVSTHMTCASWKCWYFPDPHSPVVTQTCLSFSLWIKGIKPPSVLPDGYNSC